MPTVALRLTASNGILYTHLLPAPLTWRVVPGRRTTRYARESLDLSAREVIAIGGGRMEVETLVRFEKRSQDLVDFLSYAADGSVVEYIPDLALGTSYSLWLVGEGDLVELDWDDARGPLYEFSRSLRFRDASTSGADLSALFSSTLFRFDATFANRLVTFTRSGTVGPYTDRDGLLDSAAANIPRTEWVDWDADGVREQPTLLLEAARTNVALWNRDLTNAAWTKTNVTAAKDQTGIDGVASSASKIMATAGNGTCLQAVTLASSARYQSVYVKRVTGSGTINMTMDNGATWTAITVTSTAAWTRVYIPTQTLANPTVGFRIVTNGDAIAVDFVQNEDGTAPTSPIATTTVAVTRNVDTWYAPFTHVPQAMTGLIEFVEGEATTFGDYRFVADIGNAAETGARLRVTRTVSTDEYRVEHWNAAGAGVGSSVDINPSWGNRIRLRIVLAADGSVLIGAAKDTGSGFGAETVSSTSAANALASAWADTRFYLSHPTVPGTAAYISAKVAAGVQSMATMVAL